MTGPTLNKNYFIASIFAHVIIIFGITYMVNRDATSNKNFVILGAHSRYTAKAVYKNNAVPFTGKPSKRHTDKKGSGKKNSKGKGIKKTAKKIGKKSSPKKTKNPFLNKSPRKATQQLHMPSPTAMIEETVKAPTLKKNKSKKMMPKIIPAPPQKTDAEAEQETTEEPSTQQQATVTNTEKVDLPTHTTPDEEHVDDDGDENVIHIGATDSNDPVAHYQQRVMNAEFNRLWHPPVGVRKGTECRARFTFGKDGTITHIEFTQRSQVPIYDLSVLRLKLQKFNIPAAYHGASIIMVFHQ